MTKVILFFVLLLTAFPADAAPLAVLIPIVAGAITKSLILKFAISMALTLALSALQKAMQKKPRSPGITVEQTLTGGVVSRSFVVGLYCTAGSQACPPMSHGRDGKTPNAYLTHVINISDIPVDGLTGLIVNGEEVAIGATETSVYGRPILGKYSGYGWIKFYDGTQTTADSMLVSTYGSYPNRPWTANHIGTGVAYAILTWRYNVDIFKGEPTFKFIVRGIKLYDPRKDSSVGGSGAHRWGQPNTYEFSDNNVVIMYNINRGISFADGSKWGGECEHDDLPLTNWVSGMNSCDELITGSNGPEKRFRAGYEIQVASDEPAEIQEEFLKGCSGSIAEIGGIYKIRIGGPSLPVLFISDDDIIVSNDSEYNPYPQMTDGYNSIFSTYPNPAEQWNTHDAPIVSDAAYLAQDDSIENQANVPLPTVPYPLQVQRLMQAWLKDDRRWRKHSFSLGPYAFLLEPLDSVAWSSVHNGYSNKVFEIQTATINFRSIDTVAALREADPTDFTWTADQELPDPATPGGWLLPDAQSVPGFAVEAYSITDAATAARRPAIRASWAQDGAEDARTLKIAVRVATTQAAAADVTVSRVEAGETLISQGILPATQYQARARYDVERPTNWTEWLSVTTGNILFSFDDTQGLVELAIDAESAATEIEALHSQADDLEDRILDAEGEIVTHSDTLSSYGGRIETNENAISNIEGDLVELTNGVYAGVPNLLPNGGFENGFTDWYGYPNGGEAPWLVIDDGKWGKVCLAPFALTSQSILRSPIVFNVPANTEYTLSADVSLTSDSTASYCYIDMVYLDASNDLVGESPQNNLHANRDFMNDGSNRTAGKITHTTPTGTNRMYMRLVVEPNGGTVSQAGIRMVKLESGNKATNYSAEASATESFKAIASTDIDVASLSNEVDTIGASVDDTITAISSLESNLAEVETVATSSSPNLVRNGSFENGLTGWTNNGLATPSFTDSQYWGTCLYYHNPTLSNIDNILTYYDVDAPASTIFTLAADIMIFSNSSASSCYYTIQYFNGTTSLGFFPTPIRLYANNDFSNLLSKRKNTSITALTPGGTNKVRIHLVANPNGGTITSVGIRQVKLELGSIVTRYSQEASVRETFQSLNGAFARYALTLDVNGYQTGWEAYNNGVTGAIKFRADLFEVSGGSGNFSIQNGRIKITAGGGFMLVNGDGFGNANQFIQWYGPFQTNLNTCTETNAQMYMKTDGSAYFGGSLSSGIFKNEGTSTTIDPTASIVVGPFGSNGNSIDVNFSAYFKWYQECNAGTGSISGSGAGTLTLSWSNDGISWNYLTAIGLSEVERNVVVDGDPVIRDQINWAMATSSTFTWTPGVLTSVYVRAAWSGFSTPSFSGTSLQPVVKMQRTTVIAVEQN